MENRPHVLADPRARCYPEDSELWGLLLAWAYGADTLTPAPDPYSLFGALHGLRCGGARLVAEGRTVRLTRGDWGADEWADLRERYLRPHAERANQLLRELGYWWARYRAPEGLEQIEMLPVGGRR